MYSGASRRGLGDAAAPLVIATISPATPAAGPGTQLVTVTGSGLFAVAGMQLYAEPPNLTATSTVDFAAGRVESAAADGSLAVFAIDFMGITGKWSVVVQNYYTNAVSNALTVQVVPGTVTAVSRSALAVLQGESKVKVAGGIFTVTANTGGPEVVLTGVYPVMLAGVDANGKSTSQSVTAPVPGIFVNQPGGTWAFVRYDQLTTDNIQQIANDIGWTYTPGLEVDLFGFPLPSTRQPYPVPAFDTNGNPIYSPWWNQASGGAPPATAPNTPLPPTYQQYFPNAPAYVPPATTTAAAAGGQPVLYQSPTAPPPTPATTPASAPAATLPMYTPVTTVAPASAPAAAPEQTTTPLYTSPTSVGPAPSTQVVTAAPDNSGQWLLGAAVVLGGFAWWKSSARSRRREW